MIDDEGWLQIHVRDFLNEVCVRIVRCAVCEDVMYEVFQQDAQTPYGWWMEHGWKKVNRRYVCKKHEVKVLQESPDFVHIVE